MRKVFFVVVALIMVCGLVLTGCSDIVNTDTSVFTINPVSVKEALESAKVSQFSTDAGYISMGYDKDLDSVVLTYKVGTIENMFLQYLSNVIVAAPGRKFTYTETVGHSESEQIENMSMTVVNASANIFFAGASASAFTKASFLGFGTNATASTKTGVNAGAAAGNISFNLTSVTQTIYTETYSSWLQVSHSIEQDMSVYEQGKEYAVAAFADVGVYQVLKYDPATQTATAIPGKSLYFNVESRPVWDMYEYNKENEMEIPEKLIAFQQAAITVNETDLFQDLTKTYTVTKGLSSSVTVDNSSGKSESFNPELYAAVLECFGYNKVKIDVAFRYKAIAGFLWITWGGNMKLQITNSDKSAVLSSKEFSTGTDWTSDSYSSTVNISSLKSPTCQFALIWSAPGTNDYDIGTRTITITAVK